MSELAIKDERIREQLLRNVKLRHKLEFLSETGKSSWSLRKTVQ